MAKMRYGEAGEYPLEGSENTEAEKLEVTGRASFPREGLLICRSLSSPS